jgi:hypothetical protein
MGTAFEIEGLEWTAGWDWLWLRLMEIELEVERWLGVKGG